MTTLLPVLAVYLAALGAAYIIGWRRGHAAGDHPRRRSTD